MIRPVANQRDNGDDYEAYRARARQWLAENVERVRPTSTAVGQRAGETELEFAARVT